MHGWQPTAADNASAALVHRGFAAVSASPSATMGPVGSFGSSGFGTMAGPNSRVGTRLARAVIHTANLFRSNLMPALAENGIRDGAVKEF
jgi:hypothetical protein